MAELPSLFVDLALILSLAGVVTLLFKRMRQPLVLGYVMAGWLASPNMPFLPSVTDVADVHTWADIGVTFLLFSLGLEFSFKKIFKMGSTPVIAVCTIVFCMSLLGYGVGQCFGWSTMDCVYLGGMLCMSSTTIIYKAFDEMGLRHQRFASIVLSVLILEDILAIVLMVMLSAMAVGQSIGGDMILLNLFKLAFVLVAWFVVGIYVVPLFLKRGIKWMNDETLLVVSLGLCFSMAVMASAMGFSSAFGAFVMGSILSETLEAERIERVVAPVKDLFGAIFFVSVGMLVNPSVLVDYSVPIVVLTVAILVGWMVFGTIAFLFSGQSLKLAMQCSFSMAQIGEFAFIIAAMGTSFGITSSFLYPIVVAVSVVTTFLTPYMIKMAPWCYAQIEKRLPQKWIHLLGHSFVTPSIMSVHDNLWKDLLVAVVRQTIIFSVLSCVVIILTFHFLYPFLAHLLPLMVSKLLTVVLTILFISPFLRAIVMKKLHSDELQALWADSHFNRFPLLFLLLLKSVIAVGFVSYVVSYFMPQHMGWTIALSLLLVVLMVKSRQLKMRSIALERTFKRNLNMRDNVEQEQKERKPRYAARLLSRDIHMSDFKVPIDSRWAGQTLSSLALGPHFGIHIFSIQRGGIRMNIPKANTVIFPGDKLQVIGTDEQLQVLEKEIMNQVYEPADDDWKHEMKLQQLHIDKNSSFLGKTVSNCGLKSIYHCMIVGFESGEEALEMPTPQRVIAEGDVIWLVGETDSLSMLYHQGESETNL